jgi:hypothetical protein
LHFVGEGKWSDESVLAKVRELALLASKWPQSARCQFEARSAEIKIYAAGRDLTE